MHFPPFQSRLASGAFVAACLALAGSYVAFMTAPAVGIFHDDGVYLVAAKALAEGRGYRIASLPWEPVQTKYPILFSWLLSLVWRVHPAFPDNLPWLRMVPLAFAVCWGWLSWRLFRRLGMSRAVAAVALLLVAASPWVVFLATTLLAETLFATLITAGLLVLVRIHTDEHDRFAGFAAGALMGASLLARTAGIAPAIAGLIWLAIRRQWIACLQYASALVAVSFPWFWWVAQNATEPGIDPFYSSSSYASWNIVASHPWTEKLTVVAINALYTVSFGQFWALSSPVWLGVAAGLAATVLIARGLWFARWSPVAMFVIASVAMLLAWVWPPVRFLVPLMPMLVWLAFVGTGKHRQGAVAVAVTFLAFAALGTWRLTAAVHERGGTWFAAEGVNDWPAMRQQIDWIDREAAQDAVIVAIHDPTYYLFTGRKAIRPFNFDPFLLYYNVSRRSESAFGTMDTFRRRLQAVKASYVVVTPKDGVERLISELSVASPGSLTLVNGDPASGFAIYAVNQTRLL